MILINNSFLLKKLSFKYQFLSKLKTNVQQFKSIKNYHFVKNKYIIKNYISLRSPKHFNIGKLTLKKLTNLVLLKVYCNFYFTNYKFNNKYIALGILLPINTYLLNSYEIEYNLYFKLKL